MLAMQVNGLENSQGCVALQSGFGFWWMSDKRQPPRPDQRPATNQLKDYHWLSAMSCLELEAHDPTMRLVVSLLSSRSVDASFPAGAPVHHTNPSHPRSSP